MLEHTFKTKPISANKMFVMRNKHKTADYLKYQNEIRDELMGVLWPFGTDQVSFYVEGGVSTRAADLDNLIKPLLDTYQNIFDDFNDSKVYHIELNKKIVPKGEEYISVKVEQHEERLP